MYKVMLVDDEYMILEGLKQILPWGDLGFEVAKTARTGLEALAYLKNESVDLVISDITMPEMTGIAMIDAAYKRGDKFAAIFLSGYQEFEYVKEGIRLGVKDYLVKPVDQEELLAIVKKIKEELDEAAHRQEQEQLVLENSLSRWLNDELNESDFFELMDHFQTNSAGPFTVIKILSDSAILLEIAKEAKKSGQPLLIAGGPQQHQQITLIFTGASEKVLPFLAYLKRQYPGLLKIFVGETIKEWENLYESYEKVLQMEELNNFYPDLLPTSPVDLADELGEGEFSFLAFNKSLMIGDQKTIQQELDAIFDDAVARQLQPENARYIAFLLFTDISRQYPTATKDIYEATIEKIRHSHTVYQLKALLEDVLQMADRQPLEKQFSEMTQRVIEIVQNNYRQDLTLKLVADELHLNAVYLGQVFKKEMHNSFSQYLNQIRIKRAQQLLLHSNLNINEIADEIGYNNTNYFSKMFKKLNGITPKEFREAYHGDYSDLQS